MKESGKRGRGGGGWGLEWLRLSKGRCWGLYRKTIFFLIIPQGGKNLTRVCHIYVYICMNVHVYVYVCLLCGQGWHVFDGNLAREVHEWPVFAHVRLSVLGFFFFFLHPMPLCQSAGCTGSWGSFQRVKALRDLVENRPRYRIKLLLESWLQRFVFSFPYVLSWISVALITHHFTLYVLNLTLCFCLACISFSVLLFCAQPNIIFASIVVCIFVA